jgi:hypothetical protein
MPSAVGDIVKPDQEVQVAVLRLEAAGRKPSLTLRLHPPTRNPKWRRKKRRRSRSRRTDLRGGIGESRFEELQTGKVRRQKTGS